MILFSPNFALNLQAEIEATVEDHLYRYNTLREK